MKERYLLFFLVSILLVVSCQEHRKIKYSGFNDLVVGSETLNLYENGEFDIEIGLGHNIGNYNIENDTIYLIYNETVNLPQKFILREDKFESINFKREITIRRTGQKKIISKKSKLKFNRKGDFTIEEIIKSNNYPSSDPDTTYCINWTLSKLEIEKIIKDSKSIKGTEWHHLFEHLPCQMHGELLQEDRTFKFSINSGAWVRIRTLDTTLVFGSFKEENNKYFLSTARVNEK